MAQTLQSKQYVQQTGGSDLPSNFYDSRKINFATIEIPTQPDGRLTADTYYVYGVRLPLGAVVVPQLSYFRGQGNLTAVKLGTVATPEKFVSSHAETMANGDCGGTQQAASFNSLAPLKEAERDIVLTFTTTTQQIDVKLTLAWISPL